PEQTLDALVLGDETVIPVKNVSRTTVNAGVEWSDIDRFRARISGRYSGKRRDLDYVTFANDVLHPAFLVADVSFGARLTRELRADLLVSNVTDENYYEVRGYNLPGRSFSMRLTAAF